MKRLASVLLATSFAVSPLLMAPPSFAAESTVCDTAVDVGHIIRNGHQDLRPQPNGTVVVRDEGTDRASGTFSFAVPESTHRKIPDSALPSPMYFLSATQAPDLPWFGFSAEEIDTTATVSFASVEGPGRVLAWTSSLGETTKVLLDSASPSSRIDLNVRQHLHVNWGFTEPGAYSVTFEVAFGGHTDTLTTLFLVGDKTLAEADGGSVTVRCVEQDTLPPSTGASRPDEIARSLNGITREFTALDKAWGGFTSQVLKEIYPSTTATAPSTAPTQARRAPAGEPTSQSGRAPAAPASGQAQSAGAPARAASTANGAGGNTASGNGASGNTASNAKPASNAAKPAAKPAASQATAAAPSTAEPIPDAPQAQGQAPAQPVAYAAPDTETTAAAAWRQGPWWSGLVMGLGISSLFAGVLFFFSARRVLAHLNDRG
ncbi:choice-of-anchor M domain-containing protein [Corynebacterium timonense]|uniref:choice-of-anchor M domain-containing protein n=1 Tax=Corynebacterium timonense TaxID=441500 RepID=UPI0002F4AC3C|nr:choice-of-anchor M domain-containing protein [Corynebacterium timonense]